ncbi:hypothetical protein K4A83_13440 [Spirulina subsalsa FACHB-351]|uniref:Biogenesis of lysosome-related organelles complex 1 subunit 1 n=1 Tax=Spirulina subsalsa FACHB-351 TaxID=234711 RepID=A0ABT3L6Y4_9CYAN|nr:hypothetical protein [Spirulina subsalsa]MCW6037266.1 hypothetical protein [Spirulina subsalsa FACHB-351]
MVEPTSPTNETSPNSDSSSSSVSEETKALVEQKMGGESDEVRYHMMALIEAIKKQSQAQIESTGEMTRETYVTAMRQAQDTLQKLGGFFDEQRESMEKSVSAVEDTANKNWEMLLSDMKTWGDRVDRAVDAAWKILTESNSSPPSDSDPK